MPSNLTREIISLTSTAAVSTESTEVGGIFVKGFASVQTMDRRGDIVPPEEFNLAKYRTSPTVLVNHEPWIDKRGNATSVGKTQEVFAATLVETGDEEFYGIQNDSGELVNRFPKSAAPDLSPGDRGLFAVIHVTDPDIVEKVQNGELSAFSWRGLTSAEFGGDPARPHRILRDIDLFEISLVNIPANSDATFVIGKADGAKEIKGPFYVLAVELSKDVFPSLEDARSYLSGRALDEKDIKENEKTFCSFQCHEDGCEDLIRVGLENGVSVIAAPRVEKGIDSWAATEVHNFGLDLKSISIPEVPRMSKITIEAEDLHVSTSSETKGAVTATKNKSDIDLSKVDSGSSPALPLRKDTIKSEDGTEFSFEDLVAKTTDSVVEKISPALNTLTEAVKALSETSKAIETPATPAEPVEASVEEKSETAEAKPTQAIDEDTLDNITKSILMLAQTVETIGNKVESLDAVGDMVSDLRKAIPGQDDRRESIAKSVQNDPNACFSNHPIFSGAFLGR